MTLLCQAVAESPTITTIINRSVQFSGQERVPRTACLERAKLREDNDLHNEAWVLVTQATDTLSSRAGGKTRSRRRAPLESFCTN